MKNTQREMRNAKRETSDSFSPVFRLVLMVFLLLPLLTLSSIVQAADTPERVVTAFLVTAYDYDPGTSGGDPLLGKSFCATRCNAFSTDYLNYSEAGGWSIIKTSSQELIRLETKSPFLEGQCLCTADRYEIRVNELSFPDVNVLGEKIDHGTDTQ